MAAPGAGRGTWWRWLAALLLVLLVGHAARVALVLAEGERRPDRALTVWPGHPTPLFAAALTGIGSAAREGRSPDRQLLGLVERGARSAPLAPEPLLVTAAARLEVGDLASAERMLKLAVRLDARSPAARFLLADLAIRQGRLDEALTQLAALQRRVPGVAAGLAPALVRYMQQTGGSDEVGPLLLRDPPLRETLLQSMAVDPAASGQMLALARPGDERSSWFGAALQQLLAKGDVGTARTLLTQVVPGAPLGEALTPWRAEASSNPFEWRFPQSGIGVAEPVTGGPLRVVHFGRETGPLAEHLLLLAPGRYRLTDRFGQAVPQGALEWNLLCHQGGRPLGSVAVGAPLQPMPLTVPADCPVQRLVLTGRAGDIATTVRAELLSVTIEPAGAS